MKVGITSYYYNTCNYGGAFQAFALCEFLKKNGYDAEQIKIDYLYSNNSAKKEKMQRFYKLKLTDKVVLAQKIIRNQVSKLTVEKLIENKLSNKRKLFEEFLNKIPHSDQIYDLRNLNQLNDIYDFFITGSDRVWNPELLDSPFYLEFARGKKKMAYAVSITSNELSVAQKQRLKELMHDYIGISVREKNSVALLKDLYCSNIEWVVDPTLLLSSGEWLKITPPGRTIEKKYVLCYFLGGDRECREFAKRYACEKEYILVNIAYANNKFCFSDFRFGNISLCDVSPCQFLNLLSNAEVVLTDSFHATILSSIYEKEFWVFQRKELKKSGSRIESLLTLFDLNERYINSKERYSLKYMKSVNRIDYSKIKKYVSDMQLKSQKFLLNTLQKSQSDL